MISLVVPWNGASPSLWQGAEHVQITGVKVSSQETTRKYCREIVEDGTPFLRPVLGRLSHLGLAIVDSAWYDNDGSWNDRMGGPTPSIFNGEPSFNGGSSPRIFLLELVYAPPERIGEIIRAGQMDSLAVL